MQGVLQKGQHLVVAGRIIEHQIHIPQNPDAAPAKNPVCQRFEASGERGRAGGCGTHEDDASCLECLKSRPENIGIGPQTPVVGRQADGPEGMRPLRMAEILKKAPEKQTAFGFAGLPAVTEIAAQIPVGPGNQTGARTGKAILPGRGPEGRGQRPPVRPFTGGGVIRR